VLCKLHVKFELVDSRIPRDCDVADAHLPLPKNSSVNLVSAECFVVRSRNLSDV
jgi:hypothetical protein